MAKWCSGFIFEISNRRADRKGRRHKFFEILRGKILTAKAQAKISNFNFGAENFIFYPYVRLLRILRRGKILKPRCEEILKPLRAEISKIHDAAVLKTSRMLRALQVLRILRNTRYLKFQRLHRV
jgi:hypothetical protein